MRIFSKRTLLSTSLIALVSFNVLAKVKLGKISYANQEGTGVVTINLEGTLRETPDLMIRGNLVQVAIPNSYVWPKVDKKVTINKKFDTNVMAYQYNKDLVRVRTTLPFNLKGKESQVSIEQGDKHIKLFFPMVASTSKKVVKALLKKQKIKAQKKSADQYDESYLTKLLNDKETVEKKPVKKLEKLENTFMKEKVAQKIKVEDSVSSKSSSIEKKSFDFSSYIFKFIGFFSLLVAGLYFMMNFFRKGMLKKGGLGFLTNTKMVEVVSTTYLGPKRSLLIVKVHKQVFLLSQSEKGMDFLTEITDTAEFFKDGEKQVTGDNFDTNLFAAGSKEKEFKLKEVTTELDKDPKSDDFNPALAALEMEETKAQVSLSKQIKNKLKELKPLQ